MSGLEDLQKMAQEGKVSKQLLEDNEFISEMKKIIKEENNLEISDDQVKKIIENFEQSLKDPNLINNLVEDNSVEGVSGGRNIKGTAIRTATTVAGTIIGMGIGGVTGSAVHVVKKGKDFKDIIPDKQEIKEITGNNGVSPDTLDRGLHMGVGAGGFGVIGAVSGKRLGDYICKKLGVQ